MIGGWTRRRIRRKVVLNAKNVKGPNRTINFMIRGDFASLYT